MLVRAGTSLGPIDTVSDPPVECRMVKAPRQWMDAGLPFETASTKRGMPPTFVVPTTAMETARLKSGERKERRPIMRVAVIAIGTM